MDKFPIGQVVRIPTPANPRLCSYGMIVSADGNTRDVLIPERKSVLADAMIVVATWPDKAQNNAKRGERD